MPRTPQQFEEIRNEKRKLIMDVALDHFANEGYLPTSISHIAQTAGISKGLMYNYFKSKEELLKCILDTLIDEIMVVFDTDNDDVVSEEEALNFFDFYFDMLKNKREQLKLYYQLSVQPQVVSFMINSQFNPSAIKKQKLLYEYLLRHSNVAPEIGMINISSVIKGFSMEYVFSPEMFPDEIFYKYREYLKDTLIRNK
ncbi:MAG TPA: TetR/AcrR family transcriptional regulator [Prolixibacteraceae bacterium]|nr:TetR/AcrR family transcriptional regulator [Prolixibacteraceae bacterium]HPS13969.1 TetR/AcrR family transcriptional regulator [Prolixibacteraceae bacterium]